jgi:hypothetical protein
MAYRVHTFKASLDMLDILEILRGARLIEAMHHTSLDWVRVHRWLAESHARMGADGNALGQFARAAVRGQAVGVASDHMAIVRNRVVPGLRRSPGETPPADAWIAEAVWLDELDRLDRAARLEAAQR